MVVSVNDLLRFAEMAEQYDRQAGMNMSLSLCSQCSPIGHLLPFVFSRKYGTKQPLLDGEVEGFKIARHMLIR